MATSRTLISSTVLRHESLTTVAYHQRPELGSTTLKRLSKEGAEFTASVSADSAAQQSSRAQVIGSAVHAVLDGTFRDSYVAAPDQRGYGTADTLAFLQLASDTRNETDRELLTRKEFDEAERCGESLTKRLGVHLIGRQKWHEASLFWREQFADYAVDCKCRPDLLVDDGTGGVLYLEIKTAAACGVADWRSACWRYGYWLQQPHYEAGILACGAKSVRTVFVVVRKSPPHDVRFYEFSQSDADAARCRWQRLGNEYGRRVAECDWQDDSLTQPTGIHLGLTDGETLEGFDDD